MRRQSKFTIDESSQIGEVRRLIQSWTSEFPDVLSGSLSIVINELGTNIIKHAERGEMICVQDDYSISILAIDKGQGIQNLQDALRDGYSTHGTAGNGMGAVKRMSHIFDIYSSNKGTVVLSKFYTSEKRPEGFCLEGFSLPLKGEVVSGDGWTTIEGDPYRILVSDGLGHGLLAHEASNTAIKSFQELPLLTPLSDINSLHNALKSTRGAAIAVVNVDTKKRIVDFCGLGNIAGCIATRTTSKKLISFNGTAGVQMRKIQVMPYPFEKDSLLIMHSDGLSTHWNVSDYPGLFIRETLTVAAVLYRDFNRGNDDVTVVVGR